MTKCRLTSLNGASDKMGWGRGGEGFGRDTPLLPGLHRLSTETADRQTIPTSNPCSPAAVGTGVQLRDYRLAERRSVESVGPSDAVGQSYP